MKLLFDTHAFLWWATEPERLSSRVLTACADESTQLLVSVLSAWELQIKATIGKITLHQPLDTLFASQSANGLQVLPITLLHALRVGELPLAHKDPFDRLLIAQALVEHATLISADSIMTAYNIPLLW